MNIQIRPTTIETMQEFASLLDEANTWQKARGSEGWTGPFDEAWMLPRIDRGELHLVYMDGEPVSAFRILYEDRAFWGEREVGDSIYLHTFAVRRSKAGLGIGNAVIEMIVSMGRRRGLAKVRLDCFLANTRLITFYERNGFSSAGATVVSGKMLNLMERVIGPPTENS